MGWPPSGLVVTTQERDAAMALGTLVERQHVMAVRTPARANLAGSAMVHGIDHAAALLDADGDEMADPSGQAPD